MVRTSGFHPLNRGSIPRSATMKIQNTRKGVFDLVLLMKERFFIFANTGIQKKNQS